MTNNRFVFIVPCFNAEKTIERMLMSVLCQTYDNWLILIRDDLSTDGTVEKIEKVCERMVVPWRVRWISEFGKTVSGKRSIESRSSGTWPMKEMSAKVIVDINSEKFWEVKNVLAMIRDDVVENFDIICRIDGDDFLTDLCALQDINAVYNQSGCEVLWAKHRWGDTWQNISGPLPQDADPYKHPWVTSHFKTFRKHLINDINEENFKGSDGEYIKRTGDQAIYLPILYKSSKRMFFPREVYYYTIDMSPETFASDDAKFQKSEGEFLRSRRFVK